MQNNINLASLAAIGILCAVVVCTAVIVRAGFASFRNAAIDLYKSLWNPVTDYAFKIFVIIKNLYWLPLGNDHRIFKSKFKRVENIDGNAEIVDVENAYPIAPKSGYLLLCTTVWGITIYVWFAISHIVGTIYGETTDKFIKSLPYLLAIVVAFIDTWLLRATALTSKDGRLPKVVMWVLRFMVSICIASIAMFHFFTVEYAVDIQEAANQREYLMVEKTANYSKLVTMRDALVKAHYESDARLECSKLLNTGTEGKTTPILFKREKYLALLEIYRTPVERSSKVTFSIPVGITDIDCDSYTSGDEEICPDARADKKKCPHLTSLAKKGFLSDVKTFGIDMANTRNWYDVAAIIPKTTYKQVSYVDSDKGQFEASQSLIFTKDFATKSKMDLRIAADTVSKKFLDETKLTIYLLAAPIIVLTIFEFFIIIIKTIWGVTALDAYLRRVDEEIRENLNSGVLGKVAQAELKYTSDFSMQDHIGGIFSSLRKFLEPLLQSPWLAAILFAILVSIVLIFVMVEARSFFGELMNEMANLILEFYKTKICPHLGLKC